MIQPEAGPLQLGQRPVQSFGILANPVVRLGKTALQAKFAHIVQQCRDDQVADRLGVGCMFVQRLNRRSHSAGVTPPFIIIFG